jgi:uncharacterized protein (TIGR02266 family)
MAHYWICDASNRILGPLSLDSLRELVATGRVAEITQASRDGARWQSVDQIREIAEVLLQAASESTERAQRFKASRIRARLAGMRGRRAHEVFDLPRSASLQEHREAYFQLVKPFHPDKLPKETHPDLREASVEIFKSLSALMAEAERQWAPAPIPRPLSESSTDRRPVAPIKAEKVPTYGSEEFVGIKRGKEFIEATVRVNSQNVGIFTDHSLVNLATQGVFLPTRQKLALGTLLDLRFVFDHSSREIKARGRVVWENVGAASKTAPGFGVRLLRLDRADQQFLQQWVAEKSESTLSVS